MNERYYAEFAALRPVFPGFYLVTETPFVHRSAGFNVPAFAEDALWKVDSHLSAVMTRRQFIWLQYWSAESWRNDACCAEFFSDKYVCRFAVVAGIGKEIFEGLPPVSGRDGGNKFSVVRIRTAVSDNREIKIIFGVADRCELGIAALL